MKTLIKTDVGMISNYQTESFKLSFKKHDRHLIETIADNLNKLGYMVALTLSDFRESYLLTDAPLKTLTNQVNKISYLNNWKNEVNNFID